MRLADEIIEKYGLTLDRRQIGQQSAAVKDFLSAKRKLESLEKHLSELKQSYNDNMAECRARRQDLEKRKKQLLAAGVSMSLLT